MVNPPAMEMNGTPSRFGPRPGVIPIFGSVGMRIVIGNGLKDVSATGREIGAGSVGVRTRHVAFHEVDCDRVEAAGRNYAAGKKRSVSAADRGAQITTGIEDICNQLILNGGAGIEWRSREVSVPLSRRRNHDGIGGDSVDHAASFIGREEESPIFLDRSAKRTSKLVLLVIGPPQVEVAFGIEQLVAQEFVSVAMKGVGSGLGDDVDDGARVAPVFGVERIGQDAEFRDAVGSRLNSRGGNKQIVAIASVDVEVVGAPAATVRGNGGRLIAPVENCRAS